MTFDKTKWWKRNRKGCRNAPRYCHELEIAFCTGNAVSFWAKDLQSLRDTLQLALSKVDEVIKAGQ